MSNPLVLVCFTPRFFKMLLSLHDLYRKIARAEIVKIKTMLFLLLTYTFSFTVEVSGCIMGKKNPIDFCLIGSEYSHSNI